jgi:hypothetical protein
MGMPDAPVTAAFKNWTEAQKVQHQSARAWCSGRKDAATFVCAFVASSEPERLSENGLSRGMSIAAGSSFQYSEQQ